MRVALAIASIVAVLAGSADASAWCRMTSSRRQPTVSEPCIFPDPTTDPPEQYLAWRRPCSGIALSATSPSANLTQDEVLGVLTRSVATWNSVSCGGTPIGVNLVVFDTATTCDAPLYRDGGGNVNSIEFVPDGWTDRMYDANAFAVTVVWHRKSTGEILDADMDLNERRGPYGVCPAEGCTDRRTVDLENVVTHEMGHYLGLAHSEEVMATMFVSAVAGETIKRDLHSDDIAGICEVYPPGTPEGECDHTPRGGFDYDCEGGCCAIAPGAQGGPLWPLALLMLLPLRALASRRRS